MGEGAPTEDVDRIVLTRRIDELERSQERARADFRVLRTWIDDAGERLWDADRRLAELPTLEARLAAALQEVERLRAAQEREAALHRTAREREITLRRSRTYRAGKALSDLGGPRRFRRGVSALLSIALEGRKADA